MKRVLVTGAAGFIGRHLVERLLREGSAVRALVHSDPSSCNLGKNAEILKGDILDSQLMKSVTDSCDTVFHLAGKVHNLSEFEQDETMYHKIIVEGTRNVLEGSCANGVRHFVYFSSVKAMGEGAIRCLNESSECSPTTPYGRTKLMAERMVLDYGKYTGTYVGCLRLPLVYGPGNKGNLFEMISAIDRGLFPPIADLRNKRSLVHVSNVVEAAILAAKNPVANGQCYIVTDERAYSTREIYEMICKALGRQVPHWRIPLGILKTLGWVGDATGRIRGRRFVFDSDVLDKLTGSAWYSSEKISRELGYHSSISFEGALPEMIAWYRNGES